MREKITVIYTCKQCGLTKIRIAVPTREPQEDVRTWMIRLTYSIKLDHGLRRPECQAQEISEVMIPMGGREIIGGAVIN